MRFVVDRAKWLRGGMGVLFDNKSGGMCCLGFVGEQSGIPRNEMNAEGSPECLRDSGHIACWPEFLRPRVEEREDDYGEAYDYVADVEQTNKAMEINDDAKIPDDVRERQLVELFAANGHEIVFTGEGRP